MQMRLIMTHAVWPGRTKVVLHGSYQLSVTEATKIRLFFYDRVRRGITYDLVNKFYLRLKQQA